MLDINDQIEDLGNQVWQIDAQVDVNTRDIEQIKRQLQEFFGFVKQTHVLLGAVLENRHPSVLRDILRNINVPEQE